MLCMLRTTRKKKQMIVGKLGMSEWPFWITPAQENEKKLMPRSDFCRIVLIVKMEDLIIVRKMSSKNHRYLHQD